ncbi:hypothetical protein BpHYR1_003698 [Brachionus plicatilis]|uniref:Uncharacterized protein n=1 Tax=Brachionus plicatilis TaxID=10195 RepID=A0A3M7REC4_BRAPC|nr:hypothetical protein BpHYR1_003698 [Brachionus plicatilis]
MGNLLKQSLSRIKVKSLPLNGVLRSVGANRCKVLPNGSNLRPSFLELCPYYINCLQKINPFTKMFYKSSIKNEQPATLSIILKKKPIKLIKRVKLNIKIYRILSYSDEIKSIIYLNLIYCLFLSILHEKNYSSFKLNLRKKHDMKLVREISKRGSSRYNFLTNRLVAK